MKALWKWPTPLRQIALLVYLPLWAAWQVLGLFLLLVVSGVVGATSAVAEHFGALDYRAAVVWTRATWRGEHVGRALMDYLDAREGHQQVQEKP